MRKEKKHFDADLMVGIIMFSIPLILGCVAPDVFKWSGAQGIVGGLLITMGAYVLECLIVYAGIILNVGISNLIKKLKDPKK